MTNLLYALTAYAWTLKNSLSKEKKWPKKIVKSAWLLIFLLYIKTNIAECERVEKVIKWSGRSWNHIFNLEN